MVSYKGYLIYGKAFVVGLNAQAWRSLGVVCAKASRGSIIEIRHLEGSVFKTREKRPKTMVWSCAKTGSTKIFQV
jgi:hypothetical protein